MSEGWRSTAAAAWVVGSFFVSQVRAAPNPYEMTSRAEAVVAVRVLAGSLKRARVKVEEVFKGPVETGDLLFISFRDFNLNLSKEERIEFEDGESYVLFLTPETNNQGETKRKDRFVLFRGRYGKMSLPREGAGVYLEAMGTLAKLSLLKDHRILYSQIRELVRESNPILIEAGIEEILRLRLMEASLVPAVQHLLGDPSPPRRVGGLELLAQLFSMPKEREAVPSLEETVVRAIEALGRNDPSEEVRVAAVKALGAWGEKEVEATLKEIAEQDPAQAVRYEAELVLLRGVGKGSADPLR